MQVPPEDQSRPGRAADAEKKAEPVLDAAADPAAVEAETDVLPTPVDVPVSHEAALSGQDKLESSQPGKNADLAKEDPIDVPVQVSCTPRRACIRVIIQGKCWPPGIT